MFKRITLITKKSSLSRDEFIKYYEEKHLPLCMSLLPAPSMHRRNYPVADDPLAKAISKNRTPPQAPDYDCISEVIHKTREDAARYLKMIDDDGISRIIVADEANFIEPGGIKVFIVEVYERGEKQNSEL